MKLGFLTACFPSWTLDEIAAWASDQGYEALEVAAWPKGSDRPFTATHLDVDALGQAQVDAVMRLFEERGLTTSLIAYYDNNLHPDPKTRAEVNRHVLACVEAASMLGVPAVGTFIGRDPAKSVADNLREAERVFDELVDRAGERGVKLVIENCVMEGWHPDGYPGNLAYSPELWEWMFDLGLYLNFDPSHLVWLGIDPVAALRPYVEKVVHAQAKDIEVLEHQRDRYGFFGKAVQRTDPWDVGWWRYRVPGLGQVDWTSVIDTLYEGGFAGTVSVEHEDPVWGGTADKVAKGLEISYRTLRPLIVA